LLGLATFLAYWPCLHGGFVWDDDAWTLKLQGLFYDPSGLARIWTDLTALQQYYPLTATTFWLDYHLWGFWTLPYHVENVLLHFMAVVLFWRLLKRLEVPGAMLASAVLALHPLMVESVAWITERKNVLSLVLYLAALLCYGRFAGFWRTEAPDDGPPKQGSGAGWRTWLLAWLLFLSAYLAKATAFSLPPVLLLICWWKRGRLRWRKDVLPTLPFWVASIGLGLLTAWLERTHVGARGPDWAISFPQRCLIAGRALWFYAGKLLWPANLCFIYPRWHPDATALGQWFWVAAVLLVVCALWLARRKIGRGPLTAVLFFAGTLFPLLGFFNGYFMRYSFVSDHWAYLSSLGLIALGAASIARLAGKLRAPALVYACAAVLLPVLGALTWRHSALFSNSETLYRTTLALNPNADLAHNNLGLLLAREGKVEEAIPHFERAVALRPGSAHAHNNLANALRITGHLRQAARQYELSLKLEPNDPSTCNNLALLLATSSDPAVRKPRRAIQLARRAEDLTQGQNPVVLATLATALAAAGRSAEAIAALQRAVRLALEHHAQGLAQALQAQLQSYQR
jgi:protein O-mannosyl-transferase